MPNIPVRSYEEDVIQRLNHISYSGLRNVTLVGAEEQKYPLYSFDLSYSEDKPLVLITAGIHGDEPAGVYAVLRFLEEKVNDYIDRYNFLIFPCLNPFGFIFDKRENIDGIDINRSFIENNSLVSSYIISRLPHYNQFLFALNLHEDNSSLEVPGFSCSDNPGGFFIYEYHSNGFTMAKQIISKLRDDGFEICDDMQIYDDKNDNGVVFSRSVDGELEFFLERYTKNIITTETPTSWDLEQRVSTQLLSILASLEVSNCLL